jgi:spermidine synthase
LEALLETGTFSSGADRGYDIPIVYTDGDIRQLMFADGIVQSEMMLSKPDYLVLDYTKAMMAFVLFQPEPRSILMLGLGGGSLAKFCRRCFPTTSITVVELNSDVINLRKQFAVPADDQYFRIIHNDGINYIKTLSASVDVILVDGYTRDGMPSAFGSSKFYDDCRRALRDNGILVVNLHSNDGAYRSTTRHMDAAFDHRTCRFRSVAGNNHIYFALNSPASGSRLLPSRLLLTQWLISRHNGFGSMMNRLLMRWIVESLYRRTPRT